MTLLALAALLVGPNAAAGDSPSTDPLDPTRLLGSEILVYTFDARDFDQTVAGSVTDASGSGAHGTVADKPLRIAGKHGGALQTDGSNDRVRVDGVSALQPMQQAFTISAWVYQHAAAIAGNRVIFQAETQSGHQVGRLSLESGRVAIWHTAPNGATWFMNTGVLISPDVWHHVAITHDGQDLAAIVDGNAVWTAQSPGTYVGLPIARGSVGMATSGAHPFGGRLDEVRVHDRALTPAEIRSIRDLPYIHLNDAPVADAGDEIAVGCDGPTTNVTLDGTGSYDEDGDPIALLWSADGVTFDDAASETPTAAFPVGTTDVTLSVNDAEYTSVDATRVHVVDAAPPVVASHWPSAPGVYAGSQGAAGGDEIVVLGTVTLTADASDACSAMGGVRFEADDGAVLFDDEAPYAFEYAPEGLGVQYRVVRIAAIDALGNEAPAVEVPLTIVTAAPRA